ncbi:class I SAM-dependent DNA methyltransferase [Sphingomonas abietis]|uniref:SAM-dependent methyltransferase n=1 Tax=Sphingomonas abietis TaxID=3012344 RepID=A0ABY7NLL9_9SPHN|nr:SAM-dependent methyltransferase [Sphingomonas abietis]WBO21523.1 SAM-dependent methyltransferase [Sphingomonas abietis]
MSARSSLDAAYFDGIFDGDDDPWDLASSDYEASKFERTRAALAGRRYRRAIEIGCAHGVLTSYLAPLCDDLLAIDISDKALARARRRVGDRSGVTFAHRAFPGEAPRTPGFDLAILSEVAYYWSVVDLDRAAAWLRTHIAPAGRIVLVHFTGKTDYPHSGDEAVETLWQNLGADFTSIVAQRYDRYRLDLWERR